MIRKEDIEQVEQIKKMLNEKMQHSFDYEILNQIDCLERMVKNLIRAPLYFRHSINNNNFYSAECLGCGWWGSSEFLDGGGQIADTGDCLDVYCPICGSVDLDDKEE